MGAKGKEIKKFIKERNKAYLSYDKQTILDFMYKWFRIKYIPKEQEKDFWKGVHSSIVELYLIGDRQIPKTAYEKSKKWLDENK